jgi:hypothetical protein
MWFDNWSPFFDVGKTLEEMDRILDAVGRPLSLRSVPRGTFPAINVYDQGGATVLMAEVPGVKSEDLELTVVGDSLTLTYVEQPDASDAVFDTPSGETISVPVREYRGQYVALLETAPEAGFYQARVSVQAPGIPIAVNVDHRESEVACLPESELRANLEGLGLNVAATGGELAAAIESTRTGRSAWRLFMIAALALLIFESLFADRLLRRGGSRESQAADAATTTPSSQPA